MTGYHVVEVELSSDGQTHHIGIDHDRRLVSVPFDVIGNPRLLAIIVQLFEPVEGTTDRQKEPFSTN